MWVINSNKTTLCLATCVLLFIQTSLRAQVTDTTYQIKEVVVSSGYELSRAARSTTPLQFFSANDLKKLNAIQVSDAVKFFSGVNVKDYGGIGGLKTVSVRSLGAVHTAVSYDGVNVTDIQTGQIDISRFSLNNVEKLSLTNGHRDNIFQSARLFASGAVLSINTLKPQVTAQKPLTARAAATVGSFGYFSPSVSVANRLSSKFSTLADVSWTQTDGDYPFTVQYGGSGSLTSRERRKNSSVRTLRAEVGLYGDLSEKETLRIKAYYYQSERGLPGSVVYYNPTRNLASRLWDKVAFVQAGYENRFSQRFSLLTNAKFNWAYTRYFEDATTRINNTFFQREYYASAVLLYKLPVSGFSFSFANDLAFNDLNASFETTPPNTPTSSTSLFPSRYTWLSTLAGKWVTDRFTTTANLLLTLTNEKNKGGNSAENRQRLSPAVSMAYRLLERKDFRIRAFYKDIFRLPSFNDSYYEQIGNTDLLPEKIQQYNLGLSYTDKLFDWMPFFSVTADGYYNHIKDKIVPKQQNSTVWTMKNIGRVDITGLDAALQAKIKVSENVSVSTALNYTYQKAVDATKDPLSKTYKHQIPYTPRHSGSAVVGLTTPWATASYTALISGYRYSRPQNTTDNRLDGYSDHSVSLGKTLQWGKTSLTIALEALNIFDDNYSVVRDYPMPGRSYRFSLVFNY